MGRIKFGLMQEELEEMTFGRWSDIFHAYRAIWNFEAKRCLYTDIEEEIKENENNGPAESLLNL